jgi:hypothetical protein
MAKFAQSVFYKGGVQNRGQGTPGGERSPARSPCPVRTLAHSDEFMVNRRASLTSENSLKTKFVEFQFHALR